MDKVMLLILENLPAAIGLAIVVLYLALFYVAGAIPKKHMLPFFGYSIIACAFWAMFLIVVIYYIFLR